MQNSDKTLAIALIISFVGHSFLFVPGGGIFSLSRSQKPNTIEVTYITDTAAKQKNEKTVDAYQEPELPKVMPKQASIVTKAANPKSQAKDSKDASKGTTINSTKAVADIDINKHNASPDYLQLLKAKVRNYGICPDSISGGKVNLSFTLSSDGELKVIKIIEEDSSSDHKLRLAAIECIKQANPFPPFPNNLKGQEATFNVTISFLSK
jgi:TonB family protein